MNAVSPAEVKAMRSFILGGMWSAVHQQLMAFGGNVLRQPWSMTPVEGADGSLDRLKISLASGLKFVIKIEEVADGDED